MAKVIPIVEDSSGGKAAGTKAAGAAADAMTATAVSRKSAGAQSSAASDGRSGPESEGGQVVSLYESARKIYPRAVSGLFARWRWGFVFLTQIVFYGLPWLQWNDRQAVLFDLTARKFHIFGLVLWPQDFIYLTGLLVMSALALFLFTTVAGRLWCGYACPQTVYTEMFMWLEHRIEGDRNARMKLDAGPWNARKFRVKALKHFSWVALALVTGFTFVGYFEPIRQIPADILAGTLSGWTLFWMLFYAFATWGNAGFMREQVCKYMCPYARFQSAMFDKDTLIITYDAARGEPRGSRSRKADPAALGLGSCVDCNLCVQVCPTGIDIRKGLQYECIGCAACIDVCDSVMDKMGYARGLVRYSTERVMQDPTHPSAEAAARSIVAHLIRPRTLIYTTILGAIFVAWVWGLTSRNPFRVDVIRDRNTLARIVDDGRIENVYRLQLMNADEKPHQYTISVSGIPGIVVASATTVDVGPAANRSVAVRVQIPPGTNLSGSQPIEFEVDGDGDDVRPVHEKSVFIVPR